MLDSDLGNAQSGRARHGETAYPQGTTGGVRDAKGARRRVPEATEGLAQR